MRTVIPTQQPRALTDTVKLLQNILSHAHIFPTNPSPTPVHTRARARTIAVHNVHRASNVIDTISRWNLPIIKYKQKRKHIHPNPSPLSSTDSYSLSLTHTYAYPNAHAHVSVHINVHVNLHVNVQCIVLTNLTGHVT